MSLFFGRLIQGPAPREAVGTCALRKNYCDTPLQVGCGLSIAAIFLVLSIIGSSAASGALSGVVAGGVTLGLVFPLFLSSILSFFQAGSRKDFAVSILCTILAVSLLLVGALAAAGVIGSGGIGIALLLPTVPVVAALAVVIAAFVVLLPIACCSVLIERRQRDI